jgi:hypothetical protein
MADRQQTEESTIAALQAVAKEKGDSFRVKISRKANAAALPMHLVTLDGATVTHIANLETWLPRLLGGGMVQLAIYHSGELTLPIGGWLNKTLGGEPRELDTSPMRGPVGSWSGPPELIWPTQKDIAAANVPNMSPTIASPGGLTGVPPQPIPALGHSGGAYNSGNTHALETHYAQQQAQQQLQWQQAQSQWANAQQQMQAKLDMSPGQVLQRERELSEERRRAELESLKHDTALRMQELQAQIVRAAVPVPTAPAAPSMLPAVLAAVAPLLDRMMASQNDMRVAMMKMDSERAAQSQALLTQQLSRPAVDPQFAALLDKTQHALEKARSDDPSAGMVVQMTGAMGNMMKNMMDVMNLAAESGIGGQREQEPSGMKIFKEAMGAFQSIMSGYQASVQEKIAAMQGNRGNNGNGVSAPAQLPLQEQAMPGTAAQAPAANAPVQAVRASPPVPSAREQGNALARLELLIKSKEAPLTVASAFLKAIDDPAIQAAIAGANGDVGALVEQRLGEWCKADPSNAVYLEELMSQVGTLGAAAGIFGDEEESGESVGTASA